MAGRAIGGTARSSKSNFPVVATVALVRVHDVLITVRERLKMSIYSAFAVSVRVNACAVLAMRAKRSTNVRIC